MSSKPRRYLHLRRGFLQAFTSQLQTGSVGWYPGSSDRFVSTEQVGRPKTIDAREQRTCYILLCIACRNKSKFYLLFAPRTIMRWAHPLGLQYTGLDCLASFTVLQTSKESRGRCALNFSTRKRFDISKS